jgi:hypothetical protein
MRPREENSDRELARLLRGWAAVHAPDWTEGNESDPGVTILTLFAFVAESLALRSGATSERTRRSAARLAKAAFSIAHEREPAHGDALERNNYFAGRLLGAEDFQLEQNYVRQRLRRLNRELHGAGVVRGLQVSVEPAGGTEQVVVQPGFAVDGNGEEIEVRCRTTAPLLATDGRLFVILSPAERLTHPVPASEDEQVQYTRIEETFDLRVAASADGNGVVLATLARSSGGWAVDGAPCGSP